VSKEPTTDIQSSGASPRVNESRRFLRVFLGRGVVIFGAVVLVVFILIAIFAPLISPYDPYKMDLANTLSHPNGDHLLGTDNLGRDSLSRIMYGTRTSLMIGLIVVGTASIIGMLLGLIAGYFGSWTNTIIMRIIDAMMSFPMILLALVIAALLGGGIKNVIIALAAALTPTYARLMCAQVLSVKENDYILAERTLGATHDRIMLRHIVPNCIPAIIVQITMMLGSVILAEAGLSFLGIGISQPTPAWGSMVNDGRDYLLTHPILSFAPGVTIMLLVFAFNMVGDGLRDALDPKLRGII
jgi:ABC-type dipeptide/oligopeptide/nickel transport system permease subunit